MFREYRFLLPYLRRYRTAYVLGSLCVVASILLKVYIPKLLGESLDLLRNYGQGSARVPDDPAAIRRLIVAAALGIVGVAAAQAILRTISRLYLLGTSRKAIHDARNAVFDHLLKLSPSFYVRTQTGEIMSRSVNDMQSIQGLTGPVFMYIAETATLYVICLTVMWRIDPMLTVVSFLPFPFFIGMARRLAKEIQIGSRQVQDSLGEVSSKVEESLSGHMIIKTLTLEEQDYARFAAHCDTYRDLNLQVTWARATLMPLMLGLAGMSTVVVLLLGGPRVVSGDLTLGDFVQMMLYLQMMAVPTGVLGFVISALQRGAAALGRIRELMESEITIYDPASPVPARLTQGAIAVRDLSVVYEPQALRESSSNPFEPPRPPAERAEAGTFEPRRVLDHVSFEVPAGTTLGIVGHTGSGKTTLAQALARLVEVDPGHIFVDGIDITQMRLAEYRKQVGFVPQETFLFSASLAENVALGLPDASPEALEAAVEASQLVNDLSQLPDGLETLLGERGVNLSGGQRQRTALARVLLLRPKVLILDDTLSAVDTHTADEIMMRLRPLMKGRTTVIVAHRLATVQDADHIIVLDNGRIAERGTHRQLLERGGIYAALWTKQQLREALAADLGMDAAEEVA